jgi:geranylgeranyl diphosphate synthase, type II
MHSIEYFQSIIQKKIDGFCRVNGDEEILQPVKYIIQLPAKRMRPVLALMSANLFADEVEKVIYPALALEVFHNFTLMHDDIMDNAPLRRGNATVHEKWNTNTAILSGDAMMIQAYQLMCKAPAHNLKDVLNVFSTTALEVCIGQERDMQFEKRNDVSVEEYMEMIRLKTSVLVAGAMKIGAIIAGASEKDQDLLYKFGENIGIAFQLWDDYLDAFGDQAKVGKQKGGDIIADKKTFLLLQAIALSNEEDKKIIEKYKGASQTKNAEKVEAVMSIFENLHLKDLLQTEMKSYYNAAMDALKQVAVAPERKLLLMQFAEGIMQRDR